MLSTPAELVVPMPKWHLAAHFMSMSGVLSSWLAICNVLSLSFTAAFYWPVSTKIPRKNPLNYLRTCLCTAWNVEMNLSLETYAEILSSSSIEAIWENKHSSSHFWLERTSITCTFSSLKALRSFSTSSSVSSFFRIAVNCRRTLLPQNALSLSLLLWLVDQQPMFLQTIVCKSIGWWSSIHLCCFKAFIELDPAFWWYQENVQMVRLQAV